MDINRRIATLLCCVYQSVASVLSVHYRCSKLQMKLTVPAH